MSEEKKKSANDKAKDAISAIGNAKDRADLLMKAKSMMGDDELSEALAEIVAKKYGDLPFVLKVLKERPKTFNPYLFKGMSVYQEPSALNRKTAELIALGAATALRCEYCVEAHIKRAVSEGATMNEVMDAILVAGSIAESSAISVAFRKYRQQEGKLKKKQPESTE